MTDTILRYSISGSTSLISISGYYYDRFYKKKPYVSANHYIILFP